jgi:hypothetical protein
MLCEEVINAEYEYSNPSAYKQSVYESSLIRDIQINTFFNLRISSRFYKLLPLTNRSLFPSGSNGKLSFIL